MTYKITSSVTMMIDAMDENEALSIAEDRLVEIDVKLGMFSDWSDPLIEDEFEDNYDDR